MTLASGMAVMTAIVLSSIFSARITVGMRDLVAAARVAKYCGAFSLKTDSKFQIAASASNGEPSWNFTFSRSVTMKRVLSVSSCFQDVARPGTS